MWQMYEVGKKKNDNDFARIRKYILRDYQATCQLCGSNEKPRVHHYDGDHANNTYDNLTVLCKKCHDAIHRITLIKVNGEWKVSSAIFKVLGLSDNVKINP